MTTNIADVIRHARANFFQSHTRSTRGPIYHPATPPNQRQPRSQAPLPVQHYTTATTMTLTQAEALQADLRHASSEDSQMPSSFMPDEKIFIIDTGASVTITNVAGDFISTPKAVQHTELKGIAAGLTVQGKGTAKYSFRGDDGQNTITMPNVLLVPKIPVRLLCPRHVAKITQHEEDGFNNTHPTGIFTCHGNKITVWYHPQTGLPVIRTTPGIDNYLGFLSCKPFPTHSTSEPATHTGNLSPAKRANLILHERCNHVNMEHLNTSIRQGHFSVEPSIANATNPICRACQFGKAHRKAHTKDVGSITNHHNYPGAGVSADLMEAGYPGRMLTTKGLPSPHRYKYCNFWVDYHSRYIFPTFHVTKEATEILRSKQCFEDFARRYNVSIRSIRADNGVYASTTFQQSCIAQKQNLTFCAVGGHWQNGVAERHIGVITNTARTILLHAMERWPGVITEEFWSFAVRHACTFHNASIHSDTNQSPHYMFTGEEAPWKLEHFRVFGSPVFMLAKKLQDGDAIQKWKARSWMGVYVGHSLQHAGNIPVIYNPLTTHISPQFHVVFDDQFTTVPDSALSLPDNFYEKLFHTAKWT
jgi:hypothetical protein